MTTSQPAKEARSVGTVSLKTYYNYFKAGGGILLLILTLLIMALGEVCKYDTCRTS